MRGTTRIRRCTRSTDRGDTLVEVLVAIALLMTAGVAVLGALAAAAKGAGVHRRNADVQAALASAAEVVRSTATDYIDCTGGESPIRAAYQSAVDLAVETAPDTAIDVVGPVTFWNGTAFEPGCSFDAGYRLQQITLSATSGDQTTRTIVVTKTLREGAP